MRTPLAIAVVALLVLARSAAAQPPEVNRVLRSFDFEERRLGNVEDLPMHWIKVEGPGLPHYVNGRLTTDRSRSGKYSFRFDLNGGSLIYRYEPGQIKVKPGAHYRVEGFCQTSVLPNARARITAYFTDLDGHPITQSIRHSEPYAARTEADPWKRLNIELTADSPNAGLLVLELELLQPTLYAPNTLGKRTLHVQDIRGSAWFDDITISQVPQVALSTEQPGNIFRRGEMPRVQVLVNDRFTDDLSAQLIVRDAAGKTAYQRSGALDMSEAQTLEHGEKRMTLPLPGLTPGWYEASLTMSSQGQLLGSETLDLILLADDAPPSTPDPRFGLVATDLPFDGWTELPQLLPLLSAGRIKLSVWSAAGDIQQMDSGAFDQLLERLGEMGITPTACLVDLPPAVTDHLEGKSWPQLLKSKREDWQPQLGYLVSRHANHLERWQLGADGSDAFVTRPEMREVYALVYKEFSALIEKPDLAMPWPAWYEMTGELPATVALSVPPSVLPHQIPLYMQEMHGHDGHNLSLSLELLDRERYGRPMQIRDLAQRVIYALSAGAKRIDLPLPFTVRNDSGGIAKQPQELFMILRTLTTTLSGTTFRGRVPLANGVEAFLFDRDGQGILALWDRGNVAGVKKLALNLGRRPVSVDLWGNVTPLLRTTSDNGPGGGDVSVEVGELPIFLVDIDGAQAQLRASVALDRPLMESSFQPHTRHVRFSNPYRQAISGNVKLKPPPGWIINPPTLSFSLNPGETLDRELTIEFPYNSFAGTKTLGCEFFLQGDSSGSFTVPLELHLGLSDVGMQTLALREGKDVIVQLTISNYGDKPIDYTAFALFAGQARQERLVTNLGAGRTTIKRFRLNNVETTPDSRVRVGLKEMSGTRILNDEIPVQ